MGIGALGVLSCGFFGGLYRVWGFGFAGALGFWCFGCFGCWGSGFRLYNLGFTAFGVLVAVGLRFLQGLTVKTQSHRVFGLGLGCCGALGFGGLPHACSSWAWILYAAQGATSSRQDLQQLVQNGLEGVSRPPLWHPLQDSTRD